MRPAPAKHTILVTTAGVLLVCTSCCAPHRAPAESSQSHADSTPVEVAATAPPSPTATSPLNLPGLPNLVAYAPALIAGGAPESPAAFEALKSMGVRTIVSVDGAIPDAAAARAAGIRSIHLPIGYNGFDDTRRLQLTRAVRDALARGSVYVHCHHGKHRAAGAAASIAVGLALLDTDAALARMNVSGTSPAYAGLFRCARESRPVTRAELDRVPDDFPEATPPETLVAAMGSIDEALDNVRAALARPTPSAPPPPAPAASPLVMEEPARVSGPPAAEAARIYEAFRLLALDKAMLASRPPDFAQRLTAARDAADRLERALAAGTDPAPDLKVVAASCMDCHRAYRD